MVIDQAHQALGQAIAEIHFKQRGGRTSTGDFRNNIIL
jgi:hypothetical protein